MVQNHAFDNQRGSIQRSNNQVNKHEGHFQVSNIHIFKVNKVK